MQTYSILRSWQCLELQGPDAKDFLHRLSSANFKFLRPGQFTAATLLSANGKIMLYFKALLIADGHYLVWSPAGAQAAYDALEKMHFRENFKITQNPTEWLYLRAVSTADALPPAQNLESGKARPGEGAWAGAWILQESKWNTAPIAHDVGLIVQADKLTAIENALQTTGYSKAESLDGIRIRAQDAAFPGELGPNTIPLEVYLDDAVHENKGCYPGQEVIERIRSMGQPPRMMVVVHGSGDVPNIPTPITATIDGQTNEAGTLTSAEKNPFENKNWIGLALVKRAFLKPDTRFAVQNTSVLIEQNSKTLKG